MILIIYCKLCGITVKVRLFTMTTKIDDGNIKRYGRILFAFKVERSCRTLPDEIGDLEQLRRRPSREFVDIAMSRTRSRCPR